MCAFLQRDSDVSEWVSYINRFSMTGTYVTGNANANKKKIKGRKKIADINSKQSWKTRIKALRAECLMR